MSYIEAAFNVPGTESFTYALPEGQPCDVGCRVVAQLGRRSVTGYVTALRQDRPIGDFAIKTVTRVIDQEPIFSTELLELARWMSGMYMCSLGEALAAMVPGARRESKLVSDPGEADNTSRHTLSRHQQAAVDNITRASEGMFYLYGVTGSGKTEVFLRVSASVLETGDSVIFLVPEIALTRQLVRGLAGRFGDELAVIHSRLTPSQKLREWRRILGGKARFIVGARSAIFAPVRSIGLIIIDEEHESSYKAGSTPRYHARQVAMRRRSVSHARLIMGSATPSVEAFYLMGTGDIRRHNLAERLSGGSMPAVSIVDMNHEHGTLSKALVDRIRETAREKRQVILFLNRRGFSYFFHCRTCGFEMKCRQCSVSLTYHKARGRMLCHYCGYTTRPVENCPECGSLDVGYSGFGTELIEEEVRKRFPELSVRRIDTDAVRKKGVLPEILDRFKAGEIDILLGTQMVAKGLNFPGVKLVGIVLADTGLHLPDFRSVERTFALIVQVSGRAGRYIPDGEVIIQTYHPDNDAIRLASEGDIETFYDRELKIRKQQQFPPYSRIIRLVFRGKNGKRVGETADAVGRRLSQIVADSGEVLGPAECPISIISGNTRYQLVLRTTKFGKCHAVLREFRRTYKPSSGVYMEIDVDPVSML